MNNSISRSEFLKTLSAAGTGMGLLANPLYRHTVDRSRAGQTGDAFQIRGMHIDLRVEIMTIEALKNLAKQLSSLGINALVLEYTASFPYQKHATLSNRYAYSRNEIRELVSYCDGLGIQVIPLLENLGHVQYILRHERYANLRIRRSILSQVDPLNKKAIPLFADLIDDLVSLHPSKYIHLGGDETRHLRDKKYSGYIQKHGVSKLYTQYMKQICRIAIDKGKTPLLWADMILKHPQAIEDLPVDKIIFINWIYDGADANKFGNVKALEEKGCTFWGAPALRSGPDNYFLTRWNYHFNNIQKFVPYTRRAGHKGMIMTSWSTSGIYDYRWQGSSNTLLQMFPRRNVYPLAGFNILITAYAKALKMKNPIHPKNFVIDYARQRFGLSQAEGQSLWKYLAHKQVRIGGGEAFEKENIRKIRKKFRKVSTPVQQMNPDQHQKEFEHFKVMANIRDFYLSVRQVESIVESADFNRARMDEVGKQLKPLLKRSEKLDERFTTLNKGYLYDSELERLNKLRNERLHHLCEIYC